MSADLTAVGCSPFDSGRMPCPQGGEDRWSGRWLMGEMAYARWEDFEKVIERAKQAAHNEGFNVNVLFRVFRSTPKNSGGRPQADYHLTRYAAYLTAMSGDSRKPECAAAMHYFAVKTREAETARLDIDLTNPDVALDKIIELATLAKSERAARVEAESRARELAVPASAYQQLVDSAGDWSVDDAAKVLSRDPLIRTGERRLYLFMSGIGWVFKRDGRWKAYQTQVENGRLTEKPGRPFWHAGREEMVNSEPTVRITPKGLAELHKRLGGSGQLALVAAS
jgi:DNA-damage-inducible protein D